MAKRDEVISAGFLDRAQEVMSGWEMKEVRSDTPRFRQLIRDLRAGTRFDERGWYGPFLEVMEMARVARNRARKIGNLDDADKLPKPGDLTSTDNPAKPAKRIDYNLIVVLRDPETGGTVRAPVTVTVGDGTTPSRLAALGYAAARANASWRPSWVRGEVGADDLEEVTVYVIGVVGRS